MLDDNVDNDSKGMLIFSIALNGYDVLYKRYLESHKNYAKRLNCPYISVVRPRFTSLGVECCWLKLYLIQKAIESGYRSVLFLDADALVQENAPDIRNEFIDGKSIYLVKGYSGEFNSGVILVHSDESALQFFNNVIENRFINTLTSVGWGENDGVINEVTKSNCVYELGQKWNNTGNHELQDFIRHVNHGPLRTDFFRNLFHKILNRITKFIWFSVKVAGGKNQELLKKKATERLYIRILKHYPQFVR
ncbi:hypothetical protein D210916BOD24_25030 [Alteromonas sp. D210916BOD_24]|uniref:hypothetical protein n=1 Tax=Alteromonas sp. D210916BOD_24 TaxID=3157618 RepID=UPI00399CDF89